MGIIDVAIRANETKRNIANHYLTMTDEDRKDEVRSNESCAKTPDKEKEWLLAVEETENEIKKLQKLDHLFWQIVEHWKAGIWTKPLPSLPGVGHLITHIAKTAIQLKESFSQNSDTSPKNVIEISHNRTREYLRDLCKQECKKRDLPLKQKVI